MDVRQRRVWYVESTDAGQTKIAQRITGAFDRRLLSEVKLSQEPVITVPRPQRMQGVALIDEGSGCGGSRAAVQPALCLAPSCLRTPKE